MSLPDLDAAEHAVRTGRKFGYATVGEWVLLAPGISDRAVRIYCLLRMHCQGADKRVWPAQKTLAEMLGIKKTDGIGRAIQELVALGAVDVEITAHARGRRNVYVVHEAPPKGYTQGPLDRNDFYEQRDTRRSEGVTPEEGVTPAEGVRGDPRGGGDGSPPRRGSEVTQEETTQVENEGGKVGPISHQRARGVHPSPPFADPTEGTPGVYDPANPRCRAHLRIPPGERGPDCGACARTREQQAAKDQASSVAAARALRECPMCDADGKRMDRHRTPITPYRTCDHSTPTKTILAEIVAAEAALERPRAPIAPTPASSEPVRAAALAAIRKRVPTRSPWATNTPNGFLNQGNPGHTAQVQARTG